MGIVRGGGGGGGAACYRNRIKLNLLSLGAFFVLENKRIP